MFRIFTERKNVKELERIFRNAKLDFTMFQAMGSWNGYKEPSLVIELITDDVQRVEGCVKLIGTINNQEAVFLQQIVDRTTVYNVKEDKWTEPIVESVSTSTVATSSS